MLLKFVRFIIKYYTGRKAPRPWRSGATLAEVTNANAGLKSKDSGSSEEAGTGAVPWKAM